MQEVLALVLSHARGMWRYRWWALAVSWVLCLAGWAMVYALPDIYAAKTRVYVDAESALRPLLSGLAEEPNVVEQVNVMTRSLLSRPQLEDLARDTDLDLRAGTPEELEYLVEELRSAISVSGGRDNFYEISYRDHDPRMAQVVVQELLSRFTGGSVTGSRDDTQEALDFLEEQKEEYARRLKESEDGLAAFKKRNVGRMPDSSGDYYARLQNAMAALGEARAELRLTRFKREELVRQLEGEEPVFGIALGPMEFTGQNDPKIAELEQRLADLRLEYTDRHPDVQAVLDTIERLKERRAEEVAAARLEAAPEAEPLEVNPVYQNMRIELGNTEVEIARLKALVAQKEELVEELRASVDVIPELEAELTRLTRDYEVTKGLYDSIVQRLESATLSKQAGEDTRHMKIITIEPPTVPLDPIGPNRGLFLSVTLLVGLGAGVASSFVANSVNPVFTSRDDLRDITGRPVLGAVSVALAPKQRFSHRLQMAVFLVFVGMLVAAYGGAVMFQHAGVEMAEQLRAQLT